MRVGFRRLITCVSALFLVGSVTACAGSDGNLDGPVTISVMGLPVPTQEAQRQAFLDEVSAFEAANPNITIEPSDARWDPRGFAAKLAGGTAETVIRVPLTEPGGLIARGQVADIAAELKEVAAFQQYAPKVLEPVSVDGKIFGVPESMYTLGIDYNRDLFTQAGLDPDDPPTTWDEVRDYARQIAERTGVPGYGIATTEGTGGWMLTALTYAFGGQMEKAGPDGKQVVAFTDGPTERALELLKDMRWTDNSMGTNQLRNANDIVMDFCTGRIGIIIGNPDTYTPCTQTYGAAPTMLGVGAMPQAGGNNTLVGGTLSMVNAKASPAQRAAAVKWIEFHVLRTITDVQRAAADAEKRAADGLPVGIPKLPLFDQATVDAVDAAIEPYVNIDLGPFRPWVDGIEAQTYTAEPPVAAQDVYAALDPVIQAVLTRDDADPAALLAGASDQVESALRENQQ